MIILSGPSGVGKTTVWESLRSLDARYTRSISCTTRPPRPGEKDGVDYHFLSREAFEARDKAGEFAECKSYNGNRYGTLKKTIEEGRAAGRWVGFVIEVQGAAELRRAYPDALAVFILPPSRDELLRRLEGRGDTGVEEIRQRVAIARTELAALPDYDYYVINDRPDDCAQRIHEAVRSAFDRHA